MSEQFTNNQNKELLWGLLIEQNSFNGIEPKHKSNIESIFERTIKIVDINLKNELLFHKNKEVIKQMILYLNTLKNSSHVPSVSSQPKSLNYTHDEIHKEKIEKFDNEVKQKQIEFDNIIKKDIPKSIDFSEKIDEKIGDKMDLLISQTLAMRENQLKQILSETTPPNKQNSIDSSGPLFQVDPTNNLKQANMNMNNVNTIINKDYNKLNIGEDIDTNLTKNMIVDLNINSNNNNNKKVSFDETQNIYNNEKVNELEYKTDPMKLNSFLNKLKHVENNENSDQYVEIKKNTILNEKNKLDIIINLLNEVNLKLDKVLHNNTNA